MGLTPLEGLVMGTRSGDIDPVCCIHLERSAGLGFAEIDDLLSHHSGLFGLTGHGDVRDVQAAAAPATRRPRSRSTCTCTASGTMSAPIWRSSAARTPSCSRPESGKTTPPEGWRSGRAGCARHPSRPAAQRLAVAEARIVSTDGSPIAVLVVPTNEELEIARQALSLAHPVH